MKADRLKYPCSRHFLSWKYIFIRHLSDVKDELQHILQYCFLASIKNLSSCNRSNSFSSVNSKFTPTISLCLLVSLFLSNHALKNFTGVCWITGVGADYTYTLDTLKCAGRARPSVGNTLTWWLSLLTIPPLLYILKERIKIPIWPTHLHSSIHLNKWDEKLHCFCTQKTFHCFFAQIAKFPI